MAQKIALTRLLPCNDRKQLRMTRQTQLSKNSALGDSLRSNTPISINWYQITSLKNRDTAYILSTRCHLPINEYTLTIIEACVLMIFGYVVLWMLLTFETWIAKQIMLSVLDTIQPTGDNKIMYIMMSICYIVMSLVIAMRLLILSLFCSCYMIFVGLYCFGFARESAISAFFYFVKMVFLRTIILGITVLGVGIISTIKVYPNSNPFLVILEGFGVLYITPLLYTALMIILLIVSICMMVGLRKIFWTARTVRRTTRTVQRVM